MAGRRRPFAPGGGTSRCWLGTLSATTGANSLLDFGNICLGGGNALSKGWWTNKGNPSINDPALALLAGLNLKNGSGLDFDPGPGAAGRAAVAAFLGSARVRSIVRRFNWRAGHDPAPPHAAGARYFTLLDRA